MRVRAAKLLFRTLLLVFVAGSVGYIMAREYGFGGRQAPRTEPGRALLQPAGGPAAPSGLPDRVEVFYFHGNYRCAACTRLEAFTDDAVKSGFPAELKDGVLSFQSVNVEQPDNRHFIRDYDLVSKSVVVALKAGDREVRFKNLQNIWNLLGSRERYSDYVRGEVDGYLKEIKR